MRVDRDDHAATAIMTASLGGPLFSASHSWMETPCDQQMLLKIVVVSIYLRLSWHRDAQQEVTTWVAHGFHFPPRADEPNGAWVLQDFAEKNRALRFI